MTTLIHTLLSRLKELEEKATVKPWVGDEFEMTAPKASPLIPGNTVLVWAEDYHMREWDADLVKQVRNALPSLLKLVEQAVELAEWLEGFQHMKKVDEYAHYITVDIPDSARAFLAEANRIAGELEKQ